MKKLILSTLVMAATASSVFAQDAAKTNNGGGFVRVGLGYSFPFAGTTHFMGTPISGTGMEGTTTPTPITYDLKNASYGAGFNAVIGGGYMFNRNIGIDLSVGLGIAMKKNEYTETSPAAVNDYSYTRTSYAKMPVLVMPALVFSTGHNMLEGYARVGLALPVAGKLVVEEKYTTTGGSMTSVSEIKNKLSVGAVGAVGVKYHISDMIGLWLEVNGLSMTANAKSGEVTEFTVNGVNELSQLDVVDREVEFSNNYTEGNPNQTATTPFQHGPVTSPFSNIGIGLGVAIHF